MKKHKIQNGGQKRPLLGGPKERKARKACQKAMMAFRRLWSSSHWPDESWTSAAWWFCTKAHTAWMVATLLNFANHPTHVVLDLGCTQSVGSRAAIERFRKHAWHYGITTQIFRCNKSFVFANTETDNFMESCIIHFPTAPPCSTKVHVLERSDVPTLFNM